MKKVYQIFGIGFSVLRGKGEVYHYAIDFSTRGVNMTNKFDTHEEAFAIMEKLIIANPI